MRAWIPLAAIASTFVPRVAFADAKECIAASEKGSLLSVTARVGTGGLAFRR